MNMIQDCVGICEFVEVNEFQVKPYFDINIDKLFDETFIDDIKNDITNICKVENLKFITVGENPGTIMENRKIHIN